MRNKPLCLIYLKLIETRILFQKHLIEAFSALQEIEATIKEHNEVPKIIYANLYELKTVYYKVKDDRRLFFENALSYIAYTDLECLTLSQ